MTISSILYLHRNPQEREQRGREHDVAILAAFALVHANDHALTVDVGDFQMRRFGDAQACSIADGEDGPLFQRADGLEEVRDFVPT